jgi:uncharacterized membrane protein YphA (DoxX/SURF4 family)
MSVAAALLSIALFLAFGSSGAQKLAFNPAMSKVAEHLGFTKRSYQRIGAIELVGALGLLIGLAAKGSSLLAIINEVAAGGLFLMMIAAVMLHLRKGDAMKFLAPALVLGVLVLLELIFRLAQA